MKTQVQRSLVPRPPPLAFFAAVEKNVAFFPMAVKEAARGGLDTRPGTECSCFLKTKSRSDVRKWCGFFFVFAFLRIRE